jgi:hypothetical protein
MKVNHLVPEVNGTRVGVLDHPRTKAAIEGQHLLRALHGKGHMVKAPDASTLLRHRKRSGSQRAGGNRTADELSAGKARLHGVPRQMIVEFVIEV